MAKKGVINQNRDYRRAYNRGKYFSSSLLVTYIIKNRLNTVRFGITTTKKTGNAVKRNRARRVIREAFKALKSNIKNGYDIIFVSRPQTSSVKTESVLKTMQNSLDRLGVLK